MVKKLNSIAIICMLCSSFLPSMMANCPQCSDCDGDDKGKNKSQPTMLFQAAVEEKGKKERVFTFETTEEKDRKENTEKTA